MTPTSLPVLLRRGAGALAAGRVALGLAALAWPSVPARPWVGAAADDLAAQVFAARGLVARDLAALGLGAVPAAAAGDGAGALVSRDVRGGGAAAADPGGPGLSAVTGAPGP